MNYVPWIPQNISLLGQARSGISELFYSPPLMVMNRILQSSYSQFRSNRLRSLSVAMQAVYSTTALRQANAMPFKDLTGKLDPGLLTALEEMQYEYMTPVQEKVLRSLPTLRTDW